MNGYNQVTLIGNATQDAVCKTSASGTNYARFGIAINRGWYDKKSSEYKKEVTYVNLTAFGNNAKVAGNHIKKGTPIFVEGRLSIQPYTDKDGTNRVDSTVLINNIILLPSGYAKTGETGGKPQLEDAENFPKRPAPPSDDPYIGRPIPQIGSAATQRDVSGNEQIEIDFDADGDDVEIPF